MEIFDAAIALLEKYALCDYCLGRQFAILGHGLTNRKRGEAIKLFLALNGNSLILNGDEIGKKILETLAVNGFSEIAFETLEALNSEIKINKEKCHICRGIFELIEEFAEKAVKEFSAYEYETFLIGIRIPEEVEDEEDELRARFNIRWGESIRSELSREIGKKVTEITGKNSKHKGSDIIAIINPFTKEIIVEAKPIFISGRYIKLARGIPQSQSVCDRCGGKGCQECDWAGKSKESVEELIVAKMKEITKGTNAKFHAAGRERPDVRVLGSGRPFIVEVKNPKIRQTNLKLLQRAINKWARGKIEISDLNFSSKEIVRKLKEEQTTKIYRVIVEFERDIIDEELLQIKDLMKSRFINGIEFKKMKSNLVEILFKCQGGSYIKELIDGDKKGELPNMFESINVTARCIEVDIVDVLTEADSNG